NRPLTGAIAGHYLSYLRRGQDVAFPGIERGQTEVSPAFTANNFEDSHICDAKNFSKLLHLEAASREHAVNLYNLAVSQNGWATPATFEKGVVRVVGRSTKEKMSRSCAGRIVAVVTDEHVGWHVSPKQPVGYPVGEN